MKKMTQSKRQSINTLKKYIVTSIFPGLYLRWMYEHNRGQREWNGKQSCFTLSFDCDHTEDIQALPSLLEILRLYPFKASFACIGKFIERYPAPHRMIVEAGHEILNHTYSHPDSEELNPNHKFNELSVEQQTKEIEECDRISKAILGYSPTGFRTPHFGNLHTESVYSILEKLGYRYSSSTPITKSPSFGLPFLKQEIWEFPVSACPRHPFGVFDTWHSLQRGRKRHVKKREFYRLFRELIDLGIDTNSYINVYLDPQDVVGLKDFSHMLDYLRQKESNIWIVPYKDIVKNEYA